MEVLGDRAAIRCPQCPPAGLDQLDFESTKLRLHLLLDHPESSKTAKRIRTYFIAMILLATVKLVLVSVRDVYYGFEGGWTFIEYWVSLSFILELLLRWFASQYRCRFFLSVDNIIDILAILPFFLQFIPDLQHFRLFRLFRVIRVFRMLKLSRHLLYIRVLRKTLRRSFDGLGLLFVFLLLSTVLLSTVQYNVEVGDWSESRQVFLRSDGTASPFSSIPAAMYWCLGTLTTVGYGDVVPIEPLGKLVATVSMVVGLFVLALPLVVIASNFGQVFQEEAHRRAAADKLLKGSVAAVEEKDWISVLRGMESAVVSRVSDDRERAVLLGSVRAAEALLDTVTHALRK